MAKDAADLQMPVYSAGNPSIYGILYSEWALTKHLWIAGDEVTMSL